MRLALIFAAALLVVCGSVYAQEPSFADLVIVHGHVWTVAPLNPMLGL